MKKTLDIIILAVLLLVPARGHAWSQKGHDVTAAIAEAHLTPAAADSVAAILDGKSIIYWANWLDNASYTADYAYTKTWHYKNIEEGQAYEDARINPRGDLITGLGEMIELLRSPAATKSQKALALKIVVHLMGDLHQPMHLGRAADRGGNGRELNFFERKTNLHSLWDNALPEATHKWSYTEWRDQLDRLSPEQEAEVTAGTPDDWARQTHGIAARLYDAFPKGSKVMYNQIALWTTTVEQQYLRGGLRLARLLNEIFDPAIAPTELTEPARLFPAPPAQ